MNDKRTCGECDRFGSLTDRTPLGICKMPVRNIPMWLSKYRDAVGGACVERHDDATHCETFKPKIKGEGE